ncbi:immunity 53 family protein [Streptomyces sp. ISL-100]|uniref:immunity 53 family protein n=1 Tax=Streptomyces sp. ISL-100 TaxID=2819173 RepID=UPI001BEC1DBE|nr:immunity 53 family protein [Streptomyces sp. ISL-100]MBT2398756.1 immunity 53 family protein [Streptomyces sp. ISL-100]
MSDSLLARLEKWYSQQCDGDWEHSYGVHIDTLDNPGWLVVVDLEQTELEGRSFSYEEDRTDDDWVNASSDGRKFQGAGGPSNLEAVLRVFLEFAEGGH